MRQLLTARMLVTASVTSVTPCLTNSPVTKIQTTVWISREEMIEFILCSDIQDASDMILLKMSFIKEFMIDIALFETSKTWCNCHRTL